MKINSSFSMAVSGAMAVGFFIVANFTSFFVELNVVAGIIQISINILVFFTWLHGYRESFGRKKFVAFWGIVVPPVMAGYTLIQVIIPFLF